MANNEPMDEQIERYLQADMTEQERLDFERKLTSDPDLKRDLQLHTAIDRTIADTGEDALRQTLQQIRRKNQPAPRIRYIRIAAAAATVLLLISAFFFLFPFTPQDPIANYLKDQPMQVTVMQDNDALLVEAQDDYNEGRYGEALEGMKAYLASTTGEDEHYIYAAQAALGAGKYSEARDILEHFAGEPGLWAERVIWLQALSYIGENSMDQATPLLEQLTTSTNTDLKERAEQLLSN